MVCDDGPQYESVQSPILNEGFEVLTPGVLHATNTSICTPSCKTNDHLQLVTTAVQRT